MKTQVRKTGNTIVVSLEGNLDFGTHIPLREDLTRILKQSKTDSVPTKIIFNMENLEFVGSSGISAFVQAMHDFTSHAPERPKYCNVKSEFKRIFKAFDDDQSFEFFDNEERARKSFDV